MSDHSFKEDDESAAVAFVKKKQKTAHGDDKETAVVLDSHETGATAKTTTTMTEQELTTTTTPLIDQLRSKIAEQQAIIENKNAMLDTALQCIGNHCYRWKDVPKEFREDPDCVVKLMPHFGRDISLKDLPLSLQTNVEFICHAIKFLGENFRRTAAEFKNLPLSMQTNVDIVCLALDTFVGKMELMEDAEEEDSLPGGLVRYVGRLELKDLPPKMQANHKVVLQLLKQGRLKNFTEIPPAMQTHPDVVVQAIKASGTFLGTFDMSWDDIPTSVQENPNVVVHAMKKLKLSWKRVPASLQKDPNIVMEGIRCRARDIVLPMDFLHNNRQIALEAVKSKLVDWALVYPEFNEWKNDQELSMMAMKRGRVPCLSMAPLLTEDVIQRAIICSDLSFDDLPDSLQRNHDFCRKIVLSSYGLKYGLAETVFEFQEQQGITPRLFDDVGLWEEFVHKAPKDTHSLILLQHAPDAVRSCSETMKKAYGSSKRALQYFGPPLYNTVKEIVMADPAALINVSTDFIVNFPLFMRDHLKYLTPSSVDDHDDIDELAEKIPDDMMNDPAFSKEWLVRGLPIVQHTPAEWKSDRTKFVSVAMNCKSMDWKVFSFYQFTERELFGDAVFMTEVMQFEPYLYGFASAGLKAKNFELAVLGLTSERFVRECIRSFLRSGRLCCLSKERFLTYKSQAAEEVALFDGFHRAFLMGVHLPDSHTNNGLGMLNSLELKRQIFEFAGVPKSVTLVSNMRECLKNIRQVEESENQRVS